MSVTFQADIRMPYEHGHFWENIDSKLNLKTI
jgi:hypothetical protein